MLWFRSREFPYAVRIQLKVKEKKVLFRLFIFHFMFYLVTEVFHFAKVLL